MENSEPAVAQLPTPGERLRDAREAAGISPREMADRLNWLPSHIQAVEEDRFGELRSAAFVRGYLRAYARALGLDEDEMVALFEALEPEQAQTSPEAAPAGSSADAGQNAGLWLVGLVVFAVVVIAVISWVREPESPAPAQVETPPVEAAAETETGGLEIAESDAEPEPAAPASPVEATEEEVPVETLAEVTREDSTVAAAPEPVDTVDEDTLEQAEPGLVGSQPVDLGPESAALEFSFSGDCWLEVRDGDGQLIYADLRAAGDTLRVDGIPPFEILAGDAAAVTLTYRGEPVTVRTRPGRDTARFTVGAP